MVRKGLGFAVVKQLLKEGALVRNHREDINFHLVQEISKYGLEIRTVQDMEGSIRSFANCFLKSIHAIMVFFGMRQVNIDTMDMRLELRKLLLYFSEYY